ERESVGTDWHTLLLDTVRALNSLRRATFANATLALRRLSATWRERPTRSERERVRKFASRNPGRPRKPQSRPSNNPCATVALRLSNNRPTASGYRVAMLRHGWKSTAGYNSARRPQHDPHTRTGGSIGRPNRTALQAPAV